MDIGKPGAYPGLEAIKRVPDGWALDIEVNGLLRAANKAEAYHLVGDDFRYRVEADSIAERIERLQAVAAAIRARQKEQADAA